MGFRTRYNLLDRDIEVLVPEMASDQAKRETLAKFARESLAEAEATNARSLGYVPPHHTYVDGRETEVLESVKPDGMIVFEFDLINDIFQWVDESLRQHSPVGSEEDQRPGHPGLYQRSHVFLADLKEVDLDGPIPMAEEYAFVSTVPYARKIERGLSKQAADGVYQVVAELAQQRFGNLARIKYSFRSPLFGDIHDWAAGTKLQSKQANRNRPGEARTDWLTRQPAIVITPR